MPFINFPSVYLLVNLSAPVYEERRKIYPFPFKSKKVSRGQRIPAFLEPFYVTGKGPTHLDFRENRVISSTKGSSGTRVSNI